MKTRKKKYQPVSIVLSTNVNSCGSKHSKAGSGCKAAKIVPCRI